MDPQLSHPARRNAHAANATNSTKLAFNADAAAIVIALLLAALVRFDIVPHIGW